MNSEGHRKNLLTYDYNYTGIGNANKTYWVQMFAQSEKITSVTTSSGSTSFASVKEMEAEYAQAVAWAVNNNVTAGTSATTFSPDMTCTRGQIVTFLNRALK